MIRSARVLSALIRVIVPTPAKIRIHPERPNQGRGGGVVESSKSVLPMALIPSQLKILKTVVIC
jgi:hypothetical protein